MASTKQLFFKGLCYTFTLIVNAEEELQETREAINYAPVGKYKRLLFQKENDLKQQIKRQKKILKNDIAYFGYTESDLNGKFKPYRMTEEELEKDYQQMMSEASGSAELSPEVAQMMAGE